MAQLNDLPRPSAPWHALLAPLPDDAAPVRRPVTPGAPTGSATAGWQEIALNLSAGADGLRALLVVLDDAGRPIAASDHVLYRRERAEGETTRVEYRHVSIGGRFEDDGSFNGMRWHSTSVENEAGEELENAAQPSPPDDADVAALRGIVEDLLQRAPESGEA